MKMEDTKEAVLYGFRLFPFAVLAVTGLFLNSYGPQLFSGLLAGMQGSPMYQPVAIAVTFLIQVVGGTVIFAGAFGALYRTLADAE